MNIWRSYLNNYKFHESFTRQDPGFFEMVEYFFHKACILSEDRLIDVDMENVRTTREEKAKKAHGNQRKIIIISLFVCYLLLF